MRFHFLFVLALTIASASAAPSLAETKKENAAPELTAEAVNGAQFSEQPDKAKLSPAVIKAQVLLDRAGFSPGVIDGFDGDNFQKALRAFQNAKAVDATGKLDQATWDQLIATSSDDVVASYTITDADVKGPFVKKIPHEYQEMSELEWLGYGSPRELIGEKFHMDDDLLAAMNPEKQFDKAGTKILAANVARFDADAFAARKRGKPETANEAEKPQSGKDVRVEVNKSDRVVRVWEQDGGLLAFYPASIGSEEKPAPSGKLEVRGVAVNPTYRYDPKYGFKGQKADEPVEIAPGPNGPVGVVWIALSAESYGIHGTSEPSHISKTESHGCIRLTNWDALALSRLVKNGTKVEFVE